MRHSGSMSNRLRSILTVTAIVGLTGAACLVGFRAAPDPGGEGDGAGVEPLTTELVAGSLNRPVLATHAPGDSARLFILEKAGVIKIIDLGTNTVNATPFLNINSLVGGGNSNNDERGLLGLAFHPDYSNNGQFYVNYTNNSSNTVVARYNVSGGDPDVADPASAAIMMTINQPQSNHNGGWLDFGPDGFLYIATGDGGASNDQGSGHVAGGNAQDITNNLLGKMLRIDVDGAFPFAIPPSNPFVGVTGDDEIWAYGLRNPWRNAFDRKTGDLYIADVGQGAREEINVQPVASAGGENYGWRCMEGLRCTGLSGCTCNAASLTLPIHNYNHAGGRCSITGGYVYRGSAIPTLQGHYFFADFCSAQVWSLFYDGNSVSNLVDRTAELGLPGPRIVSFGEDALGEMYVVDQGVTANVGRIFRIVPVNSAAALTDVTRTLGIFVSGGVPELLASDDSYYVLQSGPGFDPAERHPARADFGFDTGGAAASTLDITLEEKSNIGGPTCVVLLRNWVTGQWDELDRFALSPVDQTFEVTDVAAGDYISGTNRIEVRARSFAILILNPTIRGIFSHDFVGVRMVQ